MKKEINIDGRIYRLVEEEKPALEVGKWYNYGIGWNLLWLGNNQGYCLHRESFLCGIINTTHADPNESSLSDMQEVKKLLIKEAEKKGFKGKTTFTTPKTSRIVTVDEIKFTIKRGSLAVYISPGLYASIFSFRTGKWAEIVEDKKPIYTNSFGTEFFEDDVYWYIDKEFNKIKDCDFPLDRRSSGLEEDEEYTEIMTKKECYQYLADHCEE